MQVAKLPETETKRLVDEADLLKELKHKNIIQLIAFWYDSHKKYIIFITELLNGGTLRQYLSKIETPNLAVIKKWCREILAGLEYMHSIPIVHRDINCDSIYINSSSGEVKIGELGYACKLKANATSIVGSLEFMCPEMLASSYNEKCDVYSFGMALIEMITNELPYIEYQKLPEKIMNAIKSLEPPASLLKIEDDDVREFISKCISRAEIRPSAKELLDDKYIFT
jgi:WNK lysine deficient protein kinase